MRRVVLTLVGLVGLLATFGKGWTLTAVPLAAVVIWARFRAVQRGPRAFPEWMREALIEQQGLRCGYCGFDVHRRTACPKGPRTGCNECVEIDHFVAWSDGGNTTMKNGQVACAWCNGLKSGLSYDAFVTAVQQRIASGQGRSAVPRPAA